MKEELTAEIRAEPIETPAQEVAETPEDAKKSE